MRIDKTITRALALFKYFQNDYPNFDEEVPEDIFYLKFKQITGGLSYSSFNYFKSDITLLGLIVRDGRFSKLIKEKQKEFEKHLLKIEKEEIERLYKKTKEL